MAQGFAGTPHGRLQDSKRDFLRALAGGVTPQQSASIHKIFTRIHTIFARITQESRQKSTRNYARITTWNPTENSSNNFRIPCENTRIRMSHWWNIWTTRKQLLDQWNKGIIACIPPGDTRNSHVNTRDSRETKGWQQFCPVVKHLLDISET